MHPLPIFLNASLDVGYHAKCYRRKEKIVIVSALEILKKAWEIMGIEFCHGL